MKRALAPVLFLLPSLALCSSAHAESAFSKNPIVRAEEIEVGFGGLIADGAFLALNLDAKRPFYGYGMDHVIEKRSCESFNHLGIDRGFAFVSPVSASKKKKKLVGIKVTDPAQIRDYCNQIKKDRPAFAKAVAEAVDSWLFSFEASVDILINGIYDARKDARPSEIQCARPFLKGAIAEGFQTDISSQGALVSHLPEELYRSLMDERKESNVLKMSDSHSHVIEWSNASDQAGDRAKEILKKTEINKHIWHVRPAKESHFTGKVYVAFHAAGVMKSPSSTSDDGLLAGTDETAEFLAWYVPPFCGAKAGDDWYLVTGRPIKHVDSDLRATVITLGDASPEGN